MNSLTIPRLLFIAFFFCLQLSGRAQTTTTTSYQMNPELEQAIAMMRATKSDIEVLQALSVIQGREAQATQILLASISALNLEQRSGILSMVFQLPLASDGLSTAHIPLLVRLYVNSARSPLPLQPRPRSFIDDLVLQSRLLDILASLLNAESARASLAPGEPLPRLLNLLEAARASPAVPTSVQKMIEDAIRDVGGVESNRHGNNVEQHLAPPPNRLPYVQPIPKAPEAKPASPPSEEPGSSTPWTIIVVLILATSGLRWLLLKRRL